MPPNMRDFLTRPPRPALFTKIAKEASTGTCYAIIKNNVPDRHKQPEKTFMTDPLPVSRPGSYLHFLRSNPAWRRFWLAGVISQTGNWFNYIAIFVLIGSQGGGKAVGWFLIAKFIPSTIFGPVAGVIVDRYDRRKIMIFSDLARVFIVLGFLFAARPERRWLVYLLALTQESVWTFYDPARRASIPNICRPEELNLANAMSGATWSIMLALGAAAGGMITAFFGWRTAIIIDAATFVVSAAMIAGLRIKSPAGSNCRGNGLAQALGLRDLAECLVYLKKEREVAALLLVKSGWAISGGILILLTWFGEHVFPTIGPGGGSGLLYSFRGLGAAVGPILAWRILGEDRDSMYRAIVAAFFISSAAYLAFSVSPSIWIAVWFVLIGHIGGSIQWVFSTNLLQKSVADEFRGRIFAAEMGLLTLILSISTWFTGAAIDSGTNPRTVAAVLATVFILPGFAWFFYLKKTRKKA